jgi:branched-chain amino acid aminotransferase
VLVAELASLGEAFITSVSRGIVPVVRIDEQAIGAGRPGPISAELLRRFEALVEREAASVV